MPKFREVYIEKDKTLADSGTLVTELAVVDPVSEIHIRFKAKNGATSNKNNPICKNISKIELVDGSTVIYSLNGFMAQSMSYYQRKQVPSMQRQGGPSENQEDHFVLRFGRWLWDPVFALVPAKFRNLQLKITWSLTASATEWLTASAKITIIARVMEDMASEPSHYMMAKSHYSWTTAGSGDERIALPSDHPYALMLFRAWETEVKLYSTISNLKLSLDQDKDIPFDMESWDFLKMMENEYGIIQLEQHIYAGTEENIQTWLGVGETVVVTPETDPTDPTTFRAHANIYGVDSGHVNLVSRGSDHATDTSGILQMIAKGQALNHCYCIPFGRMEDPNTYLPAPEYGDVKAIITQGNEGAAANLALLQARAY